MIKKKRLICSPQQASQWNDLVEKCHDFNTNGHNTSIDPLAMIEKLCYNPELYIDNVEYPQCTKQFMQNNLRHESLAEWILTEYFKDIDTVSKCESNSKDRKQGAEFLHIFMENYFEGYDDLKEKENKEHFKKIIQQFALNLVNSIRIMIDLEGLEPEEVSYNHLREINKDLNSSVVSDNNSATNNQEEKQILPDQNDTLDEIKETINKKYPGVVKFIKRDEEYEFYIKWNNGDDYTGKIIDGDFNGHGIVNYTQREYIKYDGNFANGMYNGKGKLFFREGHVCKLYDGEFVDDMYNGKGTLSYSDNDPQLRKEITGTWSDNMSCCKGKLVYKDGRIEGGCFVNGSLKKGKIFYTERNKTYFIEVEDFQVKRRHKIKKDDIEKLLAELQNQSE